MSHDDPLGQALRQPSAEDSEDSDVPIIVRLKSRKMSLATMSRDLRLVVLATYGFLLIIILLIQFHNAPAVS